MRRLSPLPTDRVLRALKRAGWEVHGGTKHYKLIRTDTPGALSVPRSTPLKKGTIRAILRQANLSLEEFWKLYR